MTSENQFVAIRSDRIAPCMTCPICHMLFKNATTISECLHTFCKKCIYDMITKEGLDCCPVCKVSLGCAPLEKLRPDHYWQDIRALIFNSVTRKESKEPKSGPSNLLPAAIKLEETDDVHSVALPARRKKKSLSSLISQDKSLNQMVSIRRKRTPKNSSKKFTSRGSTLWIKEPIEKDEASRIRSSPMSGLSKLTDQHKKRKLHVGESSKQKMPQEGAEDPVVTPLEGMSEQWKPLNCLVEAADTTKIRNPSMPLSFTKSLPSCLRSDKAPMTKTKSKERSVHFKGVDEGGSHNLPSSSGKHRKYFGVEWKRDNVASQGGNIAPQALVNAASSMCYEVVHPIWFSLVASNTQEGDAPLPQIPSCYLRVKDANLPVSFIQKYIVKKLGLYSEAEVEITMQGHLVPPNLRLHYLIELWSLRAPKPETIKTAVGCSAEDCVMVLCYGRKYLAL